MIPEYSLIRLFDSSAQYVSDHIIALPKEDRYLRFGHGISDDRIRRYVSESMNTSNIRTHADYWFGIKDGKYIVATLHIAIRGDMAEFALTTDINYRGKKLGQLLFARGYQTVTEYSITRIFLTCLTQNQTMRHIAKKFGMITMTHGSDTESVIEVSYPVPISKISALTISIIDKNIFQPDPL